MYIVFFSYNFSAITTLFIYYAPVNKVSNIKKNLKLPFLVFHFNSKVGFTFQKKIKKQTSDYQNIL